MPNFNFAELIDKVMERNPREIAKSWPGRSNRAQLIVNGWIIVRT